VAMRVKPQDFIEALGEAWGVSNAA
jgi:hypothetical protein